MTTLRQLAEAATPGPWIEAGPSFGAPLPVRLDSVVTDFEDGDENFTICDDVSESDNCAYIAAANPTAILALLDTIDAQRKLLERAEAVLVNSAYWKSDLSRDISVHLEATK